MKRTFMITVAVAALLLGVSTAWAIPPDQGEYELTIGSFFLSDCGDGDEGVDLCEGGVLSVHWKLFFFANGDPKKYREKTTFDGFLFDCNDPDNYLLYNPANYTYTEDVNGNTVIHGLWAMITLPGHGQIYRDVGTIVFDVDGEITFEAGEHELWNGEFDVVCDFLAGD